MVRVYFGEQTGVKISPPPQVPYAAYAYTRHRTMGSKWTDRWQGLSPIGVTSHGICHRAQRKRAGAHMTTTYQFAKGKWVFPRRRWMQSDKGPSSVVNDLRYRATCLLLTMLPRPTSVHAGSAE
ncbi:hypothetical protein CHU98_g8384 [Xylaria longipes]|nr:hypothetical protein CHU98_g8384 [Xylaria longipes]